MLAVWAVLMPMAAWAAANTDVLRSWSDGALSWSDFQGTDPAIANAPSYIKANLMVVPKELEEGSTESLYTLSAKAVMNCSLSCARPEQRTDQRLRYHQLQFDVLEYYRRRLQDDLNLGVSGLAAENALANYQQLYSERIARIEENTSRGTNENRLQEEEYLVRKQLDELGLPPVPTIGASSFCYGIQAGIGGVFPTGSIADDFSGCVTFSLGLTGGYKRLRLKAGIEFGQPSFRNDNIFSVPSGIEGKPGQGNTDSYATYLGVGVTLGFAVYDSKRFTITPNVGGYWSSYGWKVDNYAYEYRLNNSGESELTRLVTSTNKVSVNHFNWTASVDFDIKVHRHVSDTPFFLTGRREEFTSTIRISPFVARAKYGTTVPAIDGYLVGVSVSYLGLARALNLH